LITVGTKPGVVIAVTDDVDGTIGAGGIFFVVDSFVSPFILINAAAGGGGGRTPDFFGLLGNGFILDNNFMAPLRAAPEAGGGGGILVIVTGFSLVDFAGGDPIGVCIVPITLFGDEGVFGTDGGGGCKPSFSTLSVRLCTFWDSGANPGGGGGVELFVIGGGGGGASLPAAAGGGGTFDATDRSCNLRLDKSDIPGGTSVVACGGGGGGPPDGGGRGDGGSPDGGGGGCGAATIALFFLFVFACTEAGDMIGDETANGAGGGLPGGGAGGGLPGGGAGGGLPGGGAGGGLPGGGAAGLCVVACNSSAVIFPLKKSFFNQLFTREVSWEDVLVALDAGGFCFFEKFTDKR
jgi:hypothetical protein